MAVIGEAFIDVIVPAWSIKRGETYHREIRIFVGGLANVAIEISKMGEEAKFVGKIGDDLFGKFLRQTLKQYGVKDLIFVDKILQTGLCISLVYENGERTMIADRGANDNLSIEEIESCIDEIKNSRIAYFSGYSLQRGETRESVLKCIKDCHEHGVEIYFNPGAPNLIKKDFREIIRNFVDVLILNEDEAKKLTRGGDTSFESLNELVDLAVVTKGKYGCTLIKNGNAVNVKTKEIKVQNTTGAGDAFSAGFIVGKLRGMDDIECAKLGNQTAARFLEERKGGI